MSGSRRFGRCIPACIIVGTAISACADSPTQPPAPVVTKRVEPAHDECRNGWVLIEGRWVCTDG